MVFTDSFTVDGREIKLELKKLGSDLVLIFSGGDKPHIGTVAIGIPRPSLQETTETSSTVSTYNFIGHKEGLLADRCADYLARNSGANVVVLGGIHYEGAGPGVIKEITEKVEASCAKIFQKLAHSQG